MPKSKSKRKNGRKVGSAWTKRISQDNQNSKAKEDAVFEKLRQQMLG
jgi:hypothetical protein